MPKFRILDKAGKVVVFLDAPEDQVAANVPPGGAAQRLKDNVDLQKLVRPPRKPRKPRKGPEAAP